MGLFNWRERRFAKRLAREVLASFRTVQNGHPDLPKNEMYQLALMRGMGWDDEQARSVVGRAERGISWWPHEKDLTLRDVVHYVAVCEYTERHGGELPGTTVTFRRIIDNIISAQL